MFEPAIQIVMKSKKFDLLDDIRMKCPVDIESLINKYSEKK